IEEQRRPALLVGPLRQRADLHVPVGTVQAAQLAGGLDDLDEASYVVERNRRRRRLDDRAAPGVAGGAEGRGQIRGNLTGLHSAPLHTVCCCRGCLRGIGSRRLHSIPVATRSATSPVLLAA